jgi:hypothetical protein
MKTKILAFFMAVAILSSCSKANDSTSNPPPASDSYLNTNSGSTWTFHEIDSSSATPQSNDYIVTSSSSDSTINNKKYHIYNLSYGGNQYLNISGHDYYQYDSIPGGLGQVIERLYLKDNAAVNSTWSQSFPVNIPGVPFSIQATLANKIVARGASRTVNGFNYTEVIQVSTSISSSAIPASGLTSDINSYYAPKYGLIESIAIVKLNYMGLQQNVNIRTQLLGAVLK